MPLDRANIHLGRCYRDTFGAVYKVVGYDGNEVRYVVYDLTHPANLVELQHIHNRGLVFSETWKARSNPLNPIVQTTSAQLALEPATPTAAGSDAHERQRPALPLVSRRHVLVAEGSIGPSPAGRDHQRLKVVLAGNADRNGAVIPMVIVDLVTRHRAAGNETDESLCRQRTRIPVAIIARLSLLGSVDAEQANTLTPKLYGVAIRDSEAMRASRAVCI